jgi:chromosomal replication initiation ATPase DnaA
MTPLEGISLLFDLDPDTICGRSRLPDVSAARQALYYALRYRSRPMSLSAIGRLLGRDHSTVIAGIAAAERRAAHDPEYRAALEMLRRL